MTLEEAAADLATHNIKQSENRARIVHKNKETRARYELMLPKVQAWKPTTPDHTNLKEFMLEQIADSINFDCLDEDSTAKWYPYFDGSPKSWRAKVRADAAKDLARAEQSLAEEIDRCNKRNAWVKAL